MDTVLAIALTYLLQCESCITRLRRFNLQDLALGADGRASAALARTHAVVVGAAALALTHAFSLAHTQWWEQKECLCEHPGRRDGGARKVLELFGSCVGKPNEVMKGGAATWLDDSQVRRGGAGSEIRILILCCERSDSSMKHP